MKERKIRSLKSIKVAKGFEIAGLLLSLRSPYLACPMFLSAFPFQSAVRFPWQKTPIWKNRRKMKAK